MRKLVAIFTLLYALCSPAAANNKAIQSVLADIEKYEQQFSGQTQPSPAKVKRTLRLLNIRAQTLNGLSDKNNPQWKAAAQRLTKLQTRLQGFLQPTTTPEKNTASSSKASVANSASKPANTLSSQQRLRLKKLQRDIDSSIQHMDKGGVQAFHDPDQVSRYEQAFTRYQQMLDKYRNVSGDADVQKAQASLNILANMLNFGKQQASASKGKYGNIQQRLKQIDQSMQALKLPSTPTLPEQVDQLNTWLHTASQVKTQAKQLLDELQAIAQNAHLPNNPGTVQQGAPYDTNDLRRMSNHLNRISQRADEQIRQLDAIIDLNLEHGVRTLERIDAYDPKDSNHRSRYFLGQGKSEQMKQQIQAVQQLASQGAQFSQTLGDPLKQQQRQALADKAQKSLQHYEAQLKTALSHMTMPKAVSTDQELLKIARDTLAKPKYGVGPIERMVITAPLRNRSEETSEEKYDNIDVSIDGTITLTGTKTVYRYEWKEFQVATAEKEADQYYIYYNTLKYFTQGARSTPLNRWVLSKRFRGNPIPKQNIHR